MAQEFSASMNAENWATVMGALRDELNNYREQESRSGNPEMQTWYRERVRVVKQTIKTLEDALY